METNSFEAETYFQMHYSFEKDKLEYPRPTRVIFKMIHDMFARGTKLFYGETYRNGDVTGKRILDIGSGPCIHSVISANKYFEEIYLSDLVPGNRMALENWRSGMTMNMDPIIQHFIDLEGSSETVDERNSSLISKIRGILAVDVRQLKPLHPVDISLCDAIVSCLCLESASTDIESFTNCIRNITPLLKDGGKLLLMGALHQTYYQVGSHVINIVKLNRESIKNILFTCGYNIVHINYAPKISTASDGTEYVSLIATKEPI